ncbi:hypothetical protein ACEWX3_07575 [Mycobacterium sp. G7A2]|uniref:hypothetical protein n=1 Tax=Mycobacterium sp. G7A2 TaxID=3317307 RepID=UPI0035A9A4E6
MTYPAPGTLKWGDLDYNLRCDQINLKWIANDKRPGDWHIAGFMEGAEGAVATGPIRGLVHVPFKGIWHEPAYGPPRYERKVDERREVSMRIALMSDSKFGWFDTESRWWDGMDGENPGYLSVFTHRYGELYIPMQLLEASETPLENDPTDGDYNCQEWDILLAADGDPRWRQPDLRPPDWVYKPGTATRMIKRDDELLSPEIEVGIGKFKVANRGTEPSWPIYTVSAPGRCWLPNGDNAEGGMIRIPRLFPGEHVVIDTNPEHRIAISDKDPKPTFLSETIGNSELLRRLFSDVAESGETILERFHGQGFSRPIAPNTLATLPVFHSELNARISVRLPQRFERAIS